MSFTVVSICWLTTKDPLFVTSMPVPAARFPFGLTPTDMMTKSTEISSPVSSSTTSPSGSLLKAFTALEVRRLTPPWTRAFSRGTVISSSNGGRIVLCISTRVVSTPASARFSATSTPMKPPPTTTALLPGSIRPLIASMSGIVQRT